MMKLTDDRILDGLDYLCCQKEICIGAYDLINRQKAEIEKYKNIKATMDEFWDILLKIKFAKRKEKPTLEEFAEALEEIKAEAIKEFWDKLKDGASYCFTSTGGKEIYATRVYSIKEIDGDNLEKETVGE